MTIRAFGSGERNGGVESEEKRRKGGVGEFVVFLEPTKVRKGSWVIFSGIWAKKGMKTGLRFRVSFCV